MALPLLQFETLNQLASNAPALAQEGFRFAEKDYMGVQPGAFQSSESSFDNGDPVYLPPLVPPRDTGRGFGRWVGPGAVHVRPGSLWLASLDSNPITAERDAATNHDDIARVAEGALTRATWTWLDVGVANATALSGQVHLVLQDAATGDILDEQMLGYNALYAELPALEVHAVLFARMEAVTRSWAMPPDYLSVRGFASVPDKFKYVENGTSYIWDYEADVGRRPTDLSHPFYALEHEAFLEGRLVHRGEWTQYISDAAEYGGPWSALRIAVGESDFAVGADFQPYPGPVLYEVTGEDSRTSVLIDPLALSVSAVPESGALQLGDNAGQCRLGGTIAGRSGPMTALWHFHPEAPVDNLSATLLGVSINTTVMMCEASLYPTVSDLLEVAPVAPETRSTELVLTRAFLHEYAPDALDIRNRLPGLPRATAGHPGGRCLRNDNGTLRFFTESFNQVGMRVGTDKFAQFYNAGREIDAHQKAKTGNGTLFHGDNCAEMCWGSFYGWAQNGPCGDEDSKQYLAVMKSGVWDDSGLMPFEADKYLWQRLRSLGTEKGIRLIASGRYASSEKPLWGISDGQQFREAWLPFRPRRLTRIKDENGKEWIYAVGRFTEQAEDGLHDVGDQWSLIRISGNYVKVCAYWDAEYGDEGAFTFDRVEAAALGLQAEQMPAFLWWVVDARQRAGGYWVPRDIVPEDERAYLILSYDVDAVAYAPPVGIGLPYSVEVWNHFCFTVHDDGGPGDGPWSPENTCTNAQCVVDNPPGGGGGSGGSGGGGGGGGDGEITSIEAVVIFKRIHGPWWASAQISDVSPIGENGLRFLQSQSLLFPNLWARIDSDAHFDDLSTYDIPLSWNSFWSLPREAKQRIDVCVLVGIIEGESVAAFPLPEIAVINNGSGSTEVLWPLPGPGNALLIEDIVGVFLLSEAGEFIVTEQL
ncbi:MAG TPA: hypothetical protein VGB77_22300 [Abditibacteriaceae bacterium]|jgi:hypothetical protein